MASTLASRLSRHSAALAISITVTALFMIYHLSPTVSYHLSPSRWTGAASVTLPSAWLSDAGHLKYAHGVAFGSKYTLLQEHAAGYSCDETEVLADGQTVCRNTISVLKSLWSNTKAQQRYLADEAARVEAEIAGQVAQLDIIEEKVRILCFAEDLS